MARPGRSPEKIRGAGEKKNGPFCFSPHRTRQKTLAGRQIKHTKALRHAEKNAPCTALPGSFALTGRNFLQCTAFRICLRTGATRERSDSCRVKSRPTFRPPAPHALKNVCGASNQAYQGSALCKKISSLHGPAEPVAGPIREALLTFAPGDAILFPRSERIVFLRVDIGRRILT